MQQSEDYQIFRLTFKGLMIPTKLLIEGLVFIGYYSKEKFDNRTFLKFNTWNKMLSSSDKVKIQDLALGEADLKKFKKELKKYKIDFSYYKHKGEEKVSILYKVKHEDILNKIIQEKIEEILKDKDFFEKVKKNPEEMTLDEKLKFYEKMQKENKTQDTSKEYYKEYSKEKSI